MSLFGYFSSYPDGTVYCLTNNCNNFSNIVTIDNYPNITAQLNACRTCYL